MRINKFLSYFILGLTLLNLSCGEKSDERSEVIEQNGTNSDPEDQLEYLSPVDKAAMSLFLQPGEAVVQGRSKLFNDRLMKNPYLDVMVAAEQGNLKDRKGYYTYLVDRISGPASTPSFSAAVEKIGGLIYLSNKPLAAKYLKGDVSFTVNIKFALLFEKRKSAASLQLSGDSNVGAVINGEIAGDVGVPVEAVGYIDPEIERQKCHTKAINTCLASPPCNTADIDFSDCRGDFCAARPSSSDCDCFGENEGTERCECSGSPGSEGCPPDCSLDPEHEDCGGSTKLCGDGSRVPLIEDCPDLCEDGTYSYTCPAICSNGKEENSDGTCPSCDASEETDAEGKCVAACVSPTYRDSAGNCVGICVVGTYWDTVKGACVPTTTVPPPPCPPGYSLVGSSCVPDPTTTTIEPPTEFDCLFPGTPGCPTEPPTTTLDPFDCLFPETPECPDPTVPLDCLIFPDAPHCTTSTSTTTLPPRTITGSSIGKPLSDVFYAISDFFGIQGMF